MSTEKHLWSFITLLVLTNVCGGVFIYHNHKMSKRQEQEILLLTSKLEESKKNQDEAGFKFLKLESKVEVIDQSVSTENKRKIRIRKTRDVIKATVDHFPETTDDPHLQAARKMSIMDITEMATALVDYCDEYDIPVALELGLLRQESAFDTRAVSKSGAQGMGQLMPDTAEDIKGWLNARMYNPWDPRHNIRFSAFYLSKLMDRFRDFPDKVELGLKAYNGGPTAVAKWKAGEGELSKETLKYSESVLNHAHEFERLGIH